MKTRTGFDKRSENSIVDRMAVIGSSKLPCTQGDLDTSSLIVLDPNMIPGVEYDYLDVSHFAKADTLIGAELAIRQPTVNTVFLDANCASEILLDSTVVFEEICENTDLDLTIPFSRSKASLAQELSSSIESELTISSELIDTAAGRVNRFASWFSSITCDPNPVTELLMGDAELFQNPHTIVPHIDGFLLQAFLAVEGPGPILYRNEDVLKRSPSITLRTGALEYPVPPGWMVLKKGERLGIYNDNFGNVHKAPCPINDHFSYDKRGVIAFLSYHMESAPLFQGDYGDPYFSLSEMSLTPEITPAVDRRERWLTNSILYQHRPVGHTTSDRGHKQEIPST